jgi:hypothetical protein
MSASELPHRLIVLAPGTDQVVQYASRRVAARMLEKQQARREGRNVLRLKHLSEMPEHPCRTFVARKGWLAAVGMSQEYTACKDRQLTDHPAPIFRFKFIAREDRPFFHQATAPSAFT